MKKRRALGGLWRHPHFLKLWTGTTVSLLGSQVTFLAVPFTAALILHATPLQMGLLTMTDTLPVVLGGLFVGVWADRLRRRPVLMSADLGRALLLGTIPVVTLLGWLRIEYLYTVAFLVGLLTICFDVAYAAFLPSVVERERLIEANSKIEVSNTLSQIAGPGIAGALIQWLSAPLAIVVDEISFFVSAGFLSAVRVQETNVSSHKERSTFWRELGEGIHVVFGNPLLRAPAACCITLNGFGNIYNALLVLYFTRDLELGAAFYGSMFAIASCSGLAGALFNPWIVRRLGTGRTLLVSSACIGGGWLLLALAGGPPVLVIGVIALGALLFGMGNTVFNVTFSSLQQQITPDHLLGRVRSCIMVISLGAAPLGAVLGGVLGQFLGLHGALLVGGIGISLGFVWVLFSPVRALRTEPS